MAEWSLYGSDRKERFERSIEPESLAHSLKQYQKVLGNSFSITELLELEKVRALALIAEAINDTPEFFMDQLGKARQESNFYSISGAIESLEDAIREYQK